MSAAVLTYAATLASVPLATASLKFNTRVQAAGAVPV